MTASTFNIKNPEIFKGYGIYWGKPAEKRDHEYFEYDFLYNNRNQLVEDYNISKMIIVDFVAPCHNGNREIYECKDGFLIVLHFYYKEIYETAISEAFKYGFKICPPVHSIKTFSMLKFVNSEDELKALLA